MSAPVAAPEDVLVKVVNIVFDVLIENLGEAAAISAATTYLPWLGLPVVREIFAEIVSIIAQNIDKQTKINVDNWIILMQDDVLRDRFMAAVAAFKMANENTGVSDADRAKALQDARDRADAVIHRSK